MSYGMGRGSDLLRGDGSDGDGVEHADPPVPRGAGRHVVAGGAVAAAEPEGPEPSATADPEPDATDGPEPAAAPPTPKRVASDKIKVAFVRARTAKAEKRRQWSQGAVIGAPQ
jgi:hypothetical protein